MLFTILPCFSDEIIQDEVALRLSDNLQETEKYTHYNFESTKKLPVKMRVLNEIKSEKNLYEGQVVEFKTTKNVIYQNQILIPKNSIIKSKVDLIITSGMNGIPASVIFSEFESDYIKTGQFSGCYEVFGQDRSLIVFPLKWALTILPPTGSFTNFIKGGHVKLKENKTITIYYYPEWI